MCFGREMYNKASLVEGELSELVIFNLDYSQHSRESG